MAACVYPVSLFTQAPQVFSIVTSIRHVVEQV